LAISQALNHPTYKPLY